MMEMAGEIFSGTSFRLGETSPRDNSLRKFILWKNITPAPALPPQRDPSVKKTNLSGATKSLHFVDQSSLVEKSTKKIPIEYIKGHKFVPRSQQ
jgi:hypothetical protein